MAFLHEEVGWGLSVRLHQHLWVSQSECLFGRLCFCEFFLSVCANMCVCICTCRVKKGLVLQPHLNPFAFLVFLTTTHRTDLSCHYSMSIHREVIVGKKPIRWAGQQIIEVMIGAVQRQLIVMETGEWGAEQADRALQGPEEQPDLNLNIHYILYTLVSKYLQIHVSIFWGFNVLYTNPPNFSNVSRYMDKYNINILEETIIHVYITERPIYY